MNILSNILHILSAEQKKYLIFIFVIIIFTTFLETLSIASFYPFLDLIINKESTESVHQIQLIYIKFLDIINIQNQSIFKFTILIVCFLYIFKILALLFCNWHTANFEFRLRLYLTKKLYKKYILYSYEKLIKKSSADIIKNIDYDLNIYASGISAIMTIATEGIILFGIIIFLLLFNFKATLITIFSLSLFVFFLQKIYNKKLILLGEISQKFEKLRFLNFLETFNAIKEIKVFGKEKIFYNSMSNYNDNFFLSHRKEIFLRSVPRAILELILIIFASFFLIFFSIEGNMFKTNFSSIGVYFIAAYRIFPTINRILTSLQRVKFAKFSMDNVKNELGIEPDNKNINFFSTNLKLKLKNEIFIKNCNYFYQDEKNTILKNLNFKFYVGKIYGIKGTSGAGKTTLLNVLTGLLKPKSGTLLVDDIEINDSNIKEFQNNISYVPQNTFLFDTSIANNIAFNFDKNAEIDKQKINILIEQLGLKKKILSLKNGIDTGTGERGINLSGGQVQRLGIARAIYKDSQILILDESTNAVEKKTEEEIINFLNSIKKNKIIILVAHRDSALIKTDEILEFKDGKLIKV